ncbi:MAG: outer membrane lipoprotein carrier protein LolA [Saprospiraceae bacterium]|nr:outer membrane lipoprotein carrier protein LolA [Saprospiraceae bacterium]MBK9221202.1 outer membrane lipoprotein carrier protein LolA [Saprospiraceae bacterium]MBK9721863.1 outer membrane lipoprotein carrier protein LolA [Saprospiraceae bacterium]MBK9728924.1 outer membrane lipoprotein carrier protein LolA [Saprospiraceae bacterium]
MKTLVLLFATQCILFAHPDPKAKMLLDNVHKQYKKMGTLEIFFSYEQTNDKKNKISNSGQLLSKGSQFKLILPDMEIYSNGKIQYTYLKNNNEVQITTPDEKENKYHPKFLSAIYLSGTHNFSLSGKEKFAGKLLTIVEFIPIDKMESINKIRLYISEKSNLIEKVEWSEKKGNNTIVTFTKTAANNLIPDTAFEFNTKNLKGVHIEDLREE